MMKKYKNSYGCYLILINKAVPVTENFSAILTRQKQKKNKES